MPRFMTVLSTCLIITILAGAAVEAAALTKVEKVALKQAIVACRPRQRARRSSGCHAGHTSISVS
ncbi:hypothetical protein [Bradyrhizobium sp. CCBAU 11361]|uniref:hypothetical protein n=1 Tax=Bradyrhizobium sp. CCBAU 11361 TaxID=1630812 RepID=UPI0023035268|nr:hypothetical protein [Bradyrhizobium sp. CCBAU 11361]